MRVILSYYLTSLVLHGCSDSVTGASATRPRADTPLQVTTTANGDHTIAAMPTEDDTEIVDLPILKSVKSFAENLHLGKHASLAESQEEMKSIQELSKKYLSKDPKFVLSKFDGSSVSLKKDLDQMQELILSMSILEDALSSDSILDYASRIQMDVALGTTFKDMKVHLASSKSALMDVIDILQDRVEIEKSSKNTNVAMGRKLFEEKKSNKRNITSSISKAEFDLRARGYEGFMVEDHRINPALHSSEFGNRFFKGSTFFEDTHFAFAGSHSSNGQRRLNEHGICEVPDEETLKSERCERLISCAKEYTIYDLFIYFFGDNIDEVYGIIDEDEVVTFFDEKNILEKYNTIQDKVQQADCDGLLQQFHRYQESTEVWKPGSVTSICRGWGTTRKGSLKGIYDFIRFRFTQEVKDEETKKMVWKEVFPTSIDKPTPFMKPDSPFETYDYFNFRVEAGTGSELFQPMFVFHEGLELVYDFSTGKYIPKQPTLYGIIDWEEQQFDIVQCSEKYGKGSLTQANSICVDMSTNVWTDFDDWRKYENDGDLYLLADEKVKVTIYDFQALKLVGQLYDEMITCAHTIRTNLKENPEASSWYRGLDVDLTRPWKGFDMENCLTPHGQLDFSECDEYEQLEHFKDHRGEDLVVKSFDEYFHIDNTKGVDSYYARTYIDVIDTMSNILFGEKTTIGQVCSYADAMERDIVQDLPGYCCLDSPDTTQWWGEQYSCSYEYGKDKGKAKPRSACRNPGPWWSSFNEDACNVYSGKWCPNPRPCEALKCVAEAKDKVKNDLRGRPFFKYLDDAPKMKPENCDFENEKKCGDLREYLQYDRDFADDERICKELEHIQCRNDFSNLDESFSNSDENEELAVDTKLKIRTKDYFDLTAAEAWRRANGLLAVAEQLLKTQVDTFEIVTDKQCLNAVSALPGSALTCTVTVTTVWTLMWYVWAASLVAYKVSAGFFETMVVLEDHHTDREIQVINFENLITTANNGITTFKAVQQVKQLLGDIADDLTAVIEDDNGRRLTENECDPDASICDYEDGVFCKCDDNRYDCNCKLNYDFIKLQRNAGCDGVDSDGDFKIDICEDRFSPRLVFTKPETFMCDLTIPDKLCFDSKIFLSDEDAKKFLRSQVQVNDDCAEQSQLDYDLRKFDDTKCSNTIFRLTPKQDYSECKDRNMGDNPFVNPLEGDERFVTMKVDDEDPIVTCGFTDIVPSYKKSKPLIEVDDKTLFHYTDDKNDESNLDSRFFYEVKDNCEDSNVDVEINISSNERNYVGAPGIHLAPYQREGYAEQVHAFYVPTICDLGGKYNSECLKDTIIEEPIRFYEIKVNATDSAGRTGMDTCHIIIAPRCSKDKKYDPLYCEDKYKYTHDYLKTLVSQSKVRYPLASEKLTWDFTLIPKFTIDVTGVDLDFGGDDDNGIFARAQSANNIDGAEISIFTIASILAVLALLDLLRRWRNRKVVEKKEVDDVVSHESTSIDE